MLACILGSSFTATLAYTDTHGRQGADAVQATAIKGCDKYVLNGVCRYVLDGHTTGLIIVAARGTGSAGEAGISLFAIPADTVDIERKWLPAMVKHASRLKLL